MPFIFDPDRAARVLDALPAMCDLMGPPEREGRESLAFVGQRITNRALYRLLANPHYPHLREALRAIENAAAAGMSLKELRNAELRGEFGSFLAEVLIADHFLRRGLSVTKGGAANGPSPDLEVVGTTLAATVEVYSPRSWQWREDWLQDMTDALKNADTPFEYAASVEVDVGEAPMTPELMEELVLRTGHDVLARLASDLDALDEGVAGSTLTYRHEGGDMTTSVEFRDVASNSTGLVRSIITSPPGGTSNSEELFLKVLAKIREKARRRQAERGHGQVRGLAVDMSRTGIDYELERGRLVLDPTTAGLELDELGLDFVALCISRRGMHGPLRGVRASVMYEGARVTRLQLGELFELPIG